jgi:DNA invertase Pin-like site-specific DNA recombinase
MFTVVYTNAAGADPQAQSDAAAIQSAGFLATMTFEEKASPGGNMLRAAQRPAFVELLRSLERISSSEPKRLVVARLERLGRDAEDILNTIRALHKLGAEVTVLQLSREDLTSATGKTILSTLVAIAELSRAAMTPRAGLAPSAPAAGARPAGAPVPAAAPKAGADDVLDLGPFSRESGAPFRRHTEAA